MAPAPLLLLQALFVTLLLLMVPSHCKVDPTSTTPSMDKASSTVFGIASGSGENHRSDIIPELWMSDNSTAVVPYARVIAPGTICVPDENFVSSGVYSKSVYICGELRVTCNNSDDGIEMSCKYSDSIKELPTQKTSQTRKKVTLEFKYPILATGFVLFSILIYCYKQNKAVPRIEVNLLPAPTLNQNVMALSLTDLKIETLLLGSGAFHRVFRGKLFDNHLVAVKCSKSPFHGNSRNMFRAELNALSRAKHGNIVTLIGYCTEKNQPRLILELMPEKDLFRHIHPERNQPGSLLFYSWKLRINVLLDVAIGIEHLHCHAEPRIIHRHITSKNILIDENWVAKISDFGISVFGPEQGRNYVEVGVPGGTAGYLEPDVRAIPENDVFSFGVVMLEVLTGRMALDGNKLLAPFAASKILCGKLDEVLEARIQPPKGNHWMAVSSVAQLATECVRVPASARPEIITVVAKLKKACRSLN